MTTFDVYSITPNGVPKDGKSYLVWHEDCGMRLLAWHEIMGHYRDDFGPYEDKTKFIRWMDKHGKWHEAKNE